MANYVAGKEGPKGLNLNGDYIYATVNKWGNTGWYVIDDKRQWEWPRDNRGSKGKDAPKNKEWDVKEYHYNGGTSRPSGSTNNNTDNYAGNGILYEKDTDHDYYIFKNNKNSDDHNSYGNGSSGTTNNAKDAVKSIPTPDGYTKEPLYLYRDQIGAPYVYVVFKKTNPNHPCLGTINTTTELSAKCLNHIWSKSIDKNNNISTSPGCTKPTHWTPGSGWINKQTRDSAIADAKLWQSKDTDVHRMGCWNYSTAEMGTGHCSKYSKQDSTGLSQECLDQIWTDAGCTTKSIDTVENSKNKTINNIAYQANLWATMNDDKHLLGCYGKLTDAKCCEAENILLQKCSHINSTQLRRLGVLKFTYYPGTTYPPTNQSILTEYQSKLELVNKNPTGLKDNYTTVITGYINFPVAKKYRFKMYNDDEAELIIGDQSILKNGKYLDAANATISPYKNFAAIEYTFLAYVKENTGDQGINIKINTEDMGDTFIDIPPSWLSSDFSMDLSAARNEGIQKACGTSNTWWNIPACIDSIKNSTVVLGDFANKIINVCSIKTNEQIENDKILCNPYYNSNVDNDKIQKSYCSVNENYLTDSNCKNILTKEEKQPLFDKYCITDKNYKINYDKCNDFYKSNNSNNLDNIILSDCEGINAFNENCQIMKSKDNYNTPITNAIDKYCKDNIDTTAININTDNCTNYVSSNIDTYNDLLTSYCEKDLANLEKNVCTKIYNDNLNDPVIQKSKLYTDRLKCLQDNKFVTDENCKTLSQHSDNKKYFIESAANYCKNNMNDKYCTDFYKETVDELKKACIPETFYNNTYDNIIYDDTISSSNNLYLFLLFLVIIIITCIFSSYSVLKLKNTQNNTQNVGNKNI